MPTNRDVWTFQASAVLLLAALPALIAQDAAAKTRTLEWDDGSCGYSMRYDDAKIDPKTLESTVDLLKSQSAAVPTAPFVYAPQQVEALDVAQFETECAAAAAAIRDAPLLETPEIEEFRRGRIEMVEDACRFGASSMRGLKDPSAFRGYQPAASACGDYVDALEGKTDLAKTWERIANEQCADNSVEEACRTTFRKTAEMGPGDAGMRLTVGVFGWNNCATKYTRFNSVEAERLAELGLRVLDAFNKRYKVKGTCDN